jgi:hypothetical protein
MSNEIADSGNWRDRAGDRHKNELEAVKRGTELQLAAEAYTIASRTHYAGHIAIAGARELGSFNDEADRITMNRPHLATHLSDLEEALKQVAVYNIKRYGAG